MSKQSFTTGQVLTAAQVNSLQANDFNQTVSVKTASYTLAAADKGTRIEFNTSASVTCTVNSGLFDAGDTLVIQNRGAGVVTVTPGTATVNTSATLALSQYDAGTLYFISNSASIFFNTDAGGGSPLTTKGDLYGFSTVDARIPIGANNTVLTADSNESLGLKWAAPAVASSGLTLITNTTISSATSKSVDNCFTSTYQNYKIFIATSAAASTALLSLKLRASSTDASTNYNYARLICNLNGVSAQIDGLGTDEFFCGEASATGVSGLELTLYAPAETNETALHSIFAGRNPTNPIVQIFSGEHSTASAFDGFTLLSDQNLTGTIRVYGIANS